MILINLKSIVQNIFPLEYNKQEITISYIVEQIASSGSIKKIVITQNYTKKLRKLIRQLYTIVNIKKFLKKKKIIYIRKPQN